MNITDLIAALEQLRYYHGDDVPVSCKVSYREWDGALLRDPDPEFHDGEIVI